MKLPTRKPDGYFGVYKLPYWNEDDHTLMVCYLKNGECIYVAENHGAKWRFPEAYINAYYSIGAKLMELYGNPIQNQK